MNLQNSGQLNKTFKHLKQKQKARISDFMYQETDAFFNTYEKMPFTEEECRMVVDRIYSRVRGLGILIAYEEIYREYRKRRICIVERLQQQGLPEHIIVKMEKVVRPKSKSQPKRRRRRQKKEINDTLPDQNDQFFYIAGYTSGGAPYVITWEEMGLEPWVKLE